ncbi:MAG: Gldg family protein [Gemmatimonadota bacterium]
MKNVWIVARKEFKSYFDHPTAYILIVAFLALGLFLAFRTLYSTGMADLRAFFDYLPWLFAVFIPAITMRSLAEERGRGTLEWLMSQPLSEAELVVGKAMADWVFALVALAGTIPTAVGLLIVSDADWGVMVAQYLGGALLAFQMVALGLLASAATRNQITAFILAAVISFALVLAGLQIVLVGLPPTLADVVTRLSIPPHFAGVSRGVVDLRDVLYFVTMGAFFLVGAYFLVVRLRLSTDRGAYRRLRIGAVLLGAGVVLLNLLGGQIRGRVDLTEENVYTLSQGTREILTELDDLITIQLFVSEELPPEIALTRRDVEDLLADFRRYSEGNLQVEILNPDEDEDVASQAESYGIQQIQFNVLREDEFQVRNGWFGMALLHAGEQEVIPFVRSSADLEYRLASAIASMTREDRPTVAFVTGFGARPVDQLPGLQQGISDRYEITSVDVSSAVAADDGAGGQPEDGPDAAGDGDGGDDPEDGSDPGDDNGTGGAGIPSLSPDSIDVLVVAGPTETLSPAAVDSIRSYLDRGGSGFFLLDRVLLEPQRGITVPLETGLEPVLAEQGIQLHADLVADFQSNQTVSMGQQQGGFGVMRSYPLWPVLLPAIDHPITRELNQMTVAWASALDITDATQAVALWQTTEYADLLGAGRSIQPDDLPNPDLDVLSTRIVAAAAGAGVGGDGEAPAGDLEREADDDGGDAQSGNGGPGSAGSGTGGGRLVVIGDADFVSPQIFRSSPQNVTFVANTVDWLAQDESLIAIRSKDRTPAPLIFDSDFQRMALRWGNLVGIPLVFVLLGLVRHVRRRQAAEKLWREISA